eukprot:766555-Hanusia_phi.AAC.10
MLEVEKTNAEYRVELEKEKIEAMKTNNKMVEMERFKEDLITQIHAAHQELNQQKQTLHEKDVVAKEVLREFASLQKSQEGEIARVKAQIAEFCKRYSPEFTIADDSCDFDSLNSVFSSAVGLVTDVIKQAEERRGEAEAGKRECEKMIRCLSCLAVFQLPDALWLASLKESLIKDLEGRSSHKDAGDQSLALIMQQISDLKQQLSDLHREKRELPVRREAATAQASQESLRTDPLLLKKIDMPPRMGWPQSPSAEQRKASRPTSSSVSVADFQDYTFTSSDVK